MVIKVSKLMFNIKPHIFKPTEFHEAFRKSELSRHINGSSTQEKPREIQ